jgi:hypothetical protein
MAFIAMFNIAAVIEPPLNGVLKTLTVSVATVKASLTLETSLPVARIVPALVYTLSTQFSFITRSLTAPETVIERPSVISFTSTFLALLVSAHVTSLIILIVRALAGPRVNSLILVRGLRRRRERSRSYDYTGVWHYRTAHNPARYRNTHVLGDRSIDKADV